MNWDAIQPDMQRGSELSGLALQQYSFPSPATLLDSEWTELSHQVPSPGSDPSLSPLYPGLPRLPSPTTPGSPHLAIGQSPSMSDMSLITLDREGISNAVCQPPFISQVY